MGLESRLGASLNLPNKKLFVRNVPDSRLLMLILSFGAKKLVDRGYAIIGGPPWIDLPVSF